jgi:uncharacterized protein (DUF433 family)
LSRVRLRGTDYIRMQDLEKGSTIDPASAGKPCIRGMRITVRRVLDLLASFADQASLLAEYPFLESEDLHQALQYAAAHLDDELPIVRAHGWNVVHTAEIGMQTAPDIEILHTAREDDRVCVTLDVDFHRHLHFDKHEKRGYYRTRREAEVVLRIAFVFAISALESVAQTSPRSVVDESKTEANTAVEDRLRSAQKRFRPEIWSGRSEPPSAIPTRSYCVYPELETRSLAFRRCSPANKIRLLPSMKILPDSSSK